MPIHTIHLVPALGHGSDAGTYERGNASGCMSELDVIDGYTSSVAEELDASRVRYELMDTRRPPGVRASERAKRISPGQCVVELRCGWFGDAARPSGGNRSRILYGRQTPFALAESLQDAVAEWGRCYVFGHRGTAPIQVDDPLLCVPGSIGFAVEPFALDGADAALYSARLATLGRTVARILASFAHERSWSTRIGGVRAVTLSR